jgi:anti-anti-sigma factor
MAKIISSRPSMAMFFRKWVISRMLACWSWIWLCILNLVAVDSIDSMGLGTLVSAFATVRKQGGELKLFNLPNKVADVMQFTKLYTVFDIMKDEAEGVKSFGQSKAAAKS